MPVDGVPPSLLVKAYGGLPPPFDQPGLAAVLKSNVVVSSTAGARMEESTHLRSSALSGRLQSVHPAALSRLNLPAAQKLQSSVLLPALYLPALHAVHWPALALACGSGRGGVG